MYLLEWQKCKTLTTSKAGKDLEQPEISFIDGGNTKLYSHSGRQSLLTISTLEESLLVSYKAKPSLLYNETSIP